MARSASPTRVSPADIVASGMCIGCGSCVATATAEVDRASPGMVFDRFGLLKPDGSRSWMHDRSPLLSVTCPFSPVAADETTLAAELYPQAIESHVAVGRFVGAYVGHVGESSFRAEGSSGGMVSWVLAELFRRDLIDGAAHVVPVTGRAPEDRFFRYRIARDLDEVRVGAKSRYYPVDMA